MGNHCRVCGIIKSFQTTNTDECGWAKQAQSGGAETTHDRLGKDNIDDSLSVLALATEGHCCNCQRKKAGWSLPDFKQRACQHCLARRKLRVWNENKLNLGKPRNLARSESDPTDFTSSASLPDPAVAILMAEPAPMKHMPLSMSMGNVRAAADRSGLRACTGVEIITKAMRLLGFSERDCDVAERRQLAPAAMVACSRKELRDLGLVATPQQHTMLMAFARGFIAQDDLCPRFLPQTPPGTPRESENACASRSSRSPPMPDDGSMSLLLPQTPPLTASPPPAAAAAVITLSDPFCNSPLSVIEAEENRRE